MVLPRYSRPLFALFLILGVLALRWPVLDRQIWNLDEGSTITMAQQVLAGQVLFRDAADNRTPLVPYLKALVLAVAGDWNTRAIHLALALMIGVTAVLLWQISRRLGREAVGVFAALSFLCLSTGLLPPVDSLCAHTGWFLIFFSAAGFWFCSVAVTRQSHTAAGASGLSFGLAMLAKQPGLLDFGVAICLVLLLALGRERTVAGRLLPALVAGLLLPLTITLGYFHAQGALADLRFYAWTYNTEYYVPEVPLPSRLAAIRVPFGLLLERMPAALALGSAAAAGLLALVFFRERREPSRALLAWLTLGWSASGLLSTALSGREFTHYSIQVLPGASLACGWGLAWLWQRSYLRQAGRLVAAGVLLSFLIPGIHGIHTVDQDDGFGAKLGEAIQRSSRSDERMFVWGYMPELHVFARRLPATRFIYTNWITGLIPWTNTDWLKDTSYAVIPGADRQLQEDFLRRPPAVIVDTGSLRTYLKYPLSGQAWLHRQVLSEFAEVEPATTNPAGFRIYRRTTAGGIGEPLPVDVPVDDALHVELPAGQASENLRVTVRYPANTHSLALYQNGRLYRRLDLLSPAAGAVVFHVLEDDLALGEHRFTALARGAGLTASPIARLEISAPRPPDPAGPPLEFGRRSLTPLVATNLDGPLQPQPVTGWWDAQAPARVAYARPPGLGAIEFEYQMSPLLGQDPARWHTDGIDFIVTYASSVGETTELFRRHLNAVQNAADRGPQLSRVDLPLEESGLVTLTISPGPASDPSSDWLLLMAVRGKGLPAELAFRDQSLPASRIATSLGMAQVDLGGREVYLIHAPSAMEFPLEPTMARFSATFGLVDSAWSGSEGSAGATFEIWHLPPDSHPVLLRALPLDPMQNPQHRGPQQLSLDLPHPSFGSIRLVTRPTYPGNNAFNQTYWADLIATELPVPVATPSGALVQEKMETRFGAASVDNREQPVFYLHAPSALVYRLPAGLSRLQGSFGLLDAAYAGAEISAGGRFVIDGEYADGRRIELWSHDLDPVNREEDRGSLSFSVPIPQDNLKRLILRTEARPGHSLARAWTFWHDLHLAP